MVSVLPLYFVFQETYALESKSVLLEGDVDFIDLGGEVSDHLFLPALTALCHFNIQ